MAAAGAPAIEHPNRDSRRARATRGTVVTLLLLSALLVAVITAGGWTAIQGAKAPAIAFVVLDLALAAAIARWRAGLLPAAGAAAGVLATFALVSAPQWFDRDRAGFDDPLLDAGVLGLLTALLVPLQLALIAFAARGFAQRWSVERRRPPGAPAP